MRYSHIKGILKRISSAPLYPLYSHARTVTIAYPCPISVAAREADDPQGIRIDNFGGVLCVCVWVWVWVWVFLWPWLWLHTHTNTQRPRPIPHSPFPIPHAPCPMPHAHCPLPIAHGHILYSGCCRVPRVPESMTSKMLLAFPKGTCTQTVYTLTLQSFLYRNFRAKLYAIWVHGPLGIGCPAKLESPGPSITALACTRLFLCRQDYG